jgi:DNA-binding PadR family transcriptional regulator
MPVKHALLALLRERDLTGYELKIRFERIVGEFWQLNSGQVYSTLERLRREGMVARQRNVIDRVAEATEESTARAAFSIRPRGRHALAEWMAAPMGRLRPVRDPIFVKLAFSEPEHLARMLRAFAEETRRYREAAETLRALVAREPMSHGGRVRWLVAEAARRTYEAHLGWLECVQQTLGRTAAPGPRHAGPRSMPRRTVGTPTPRDAVA